MNQSIEAAIRRALGDMGVQQQEPKEDEEQQPPHVPIEAVLSAAIGDRPVAFPGPAINGVRGLNDDRGIARALGADTLNGERL